MALLGSLLWDSVASLLTLFLIALWYATAEFDFFKNRNIPYVKPLPFVGNFWSVVIGRESMNAAIVPLYEKLKRNKFGGIFFSRAPVLLICDPELAKTVLTKDFSSLHDRGIPCDDENDPLSVNLANLPGTRWKYLRSKVSPTYSTGKLKLMFHLMKDCSEDLTKVLLEKATKGEDVELKDYLVRYSTDVVGICGFGIKCHCLTNPNSEFFILSRKIFKPSILSLVRFTFSNCKLLMKILPFKRVFPGVYKFFRDLVQESVNFRQENNVERNDFVHLMMQLQKGDAGKIPKDYPDQVIFTDDIMTAQAGVFFIAGLDIIANAVGFALHYLALDPGMQEDLADEVISVLNNHDGELSYESLKDMKMVDRVISESLRMYFPAGILFREVNSPSYKLPGSDTIFKKGTKFVIPVQGFHYDPEIYPEPTKFDPSRFTEEEVAKRHPYTYMPFGEGPRICIARRFSIMECKLCLASLIRDYRFSVCSKTEVPLQLEPRAFSPTPKEGFNLKIELRNL